MACIFWSAFTRSLLRPAAGLPPALLPLNRGWSLVAGSVGLAPKAWD